MGQDLDAASSMLAYEHVDRGNLSGDDRDFFGSDQRAYGGRDYRTTRCNPGTLRIGSTSYAIPAGGPHAGQCGEPRGRHAEPVR